MQPRVINESMLNLSEDELKALAGTKNKQKIKSWLVSLNINYLPDVNGFPKVSREIMNKKLSGDEELSKPDRKRGNADALRTLMGVK